MYENNFINDIIKWYGCISGMTEYKVPKVMKMNGEGECWALRLSSWYEQYIWSSVTSELKSMLEETVSYII